jgi:hypothetical protein
MKSKLETDQGREKSRSNDSWCFLLKKRPAVQLAVKSLNSSRIHEEKIFFYHSSTIKYLLVKYYSSFFITTTSNLSNN